VISETALSSGYSFFSAVTRRTAAGSIAGAVNARRDVAGTGNEHRRDVLERVEAL
jgi:hypothetical protein